MSIVACRHCCSALGQVLLCCQLILLCLEFAFGLWWERCAPGVTSLLSFRYATVYTMFPVFSLVLDQDVKPEMAMLYPELYKDLTKVRPARPKQGGCSALRETVLVRRVHPPVRTVAPARRRPQAGPAPASWSCRDSYLGGPGAWGLHRLPTRSHETHVLRH